MKTILIFIPSIVLVFSVFGQDTSRLNLRKEVEGNFERLSQRSRTPQHAMETEIGKMLSFNMKTDFLKDSIAFYSFAIKVSLKFIKNQAQVYQITSNNQICYQLWPNLNDMLRKNINFNIFLNKKLTPQIIIPVGIIVINYDNKKPNDTLDLRSLPTRIELLLDSNDGHGNYNSTYLAPKIITVDKRTYD